MLCITVPQLLQQLLCLVIGILMDPINREVLVIGILMDPMLLEYFVLLLRAILLLVVGRARNASYLCSGSVPWYQKRSWCGGELGHPEDLVGPSVHPFGPPLGTYWAHRKHVMNPVDALHGP